MDKSRLQYPLYSRICPGGTQTEPVELNSDGHTGDWHELWLNENVLIWGIWVTGGYFIAGFPWIPLYIYFDAENLTVLLNWKKIKYKIAERTNDNQFHQKHYQLNVDC